MGKSPSYVTTFEIRDDDNDPQTKLSMECSASNDSSVSDVSESDCESKQELLTVVNQSSDPSATQLPSYRRIYPSLPATSE